MLQWMNSSLFKLNIKRMFKTRNSINTKLFMEKKQKILNLYAVSLKRNDPRSLYYQGMVDFAEEVLNEKNTP